MGISLCTQIRDRNKHLEEAFPTWLPYSFDEIIIVDSPVQKSAWEVISKQATSNLRYIRILDDIPYNISKMKNACIRAAKSDIVLYVDSDIKIKPTAPEELIRAFVFDRGSFLQGDRDSIITWTTGTFSFHKKDYDSLGGFNELLKDYGGEDGDLYYRFLKNNLVRLPLPPMFEHINHSNELRTQYYNDKDIVVSGYKNTIKARSHKWSVSDPQQQYSVQETVYTGAITSYLL